MTDHHETTAQLRRLIEMAQQLRRVAEDCQLRYNPAVEHLTLCLTHLRRELLHRPLSKQPPHPEPPAMHTHIELLKLVTAVARILDAAHHNLAQVEAHPHTTLHKLQRRLAKLTNDFHDFLTLMN